jgi:perosamine synthetase
LGAAEKDIANGHAGVGPEVSRGAIKVDQMKQFIPVAAPALVGNEKEYVLDCLESTWISSSGKYIERFEAAFAEFCGVKHALSCCNGTVALHLALLALGVGPGDEVIVPTLTYVASANAVAYCGARPVLVDSEPETWNVNPEAILSRITPRTRGIMVVHLYGHPTDMEPVLKLARERGLFVLEDAAEAHGAEYKGRRAGSLGDIATFSFYGNKIVTTGEGGMVVTDDDELARKVRLLKGQGQDPERRYWFPVLGYNYRMTNVEAAIGLAQMEKIDWHIWRRRENAAWYRKHLGGDARFTLSPEAPWARNAYWINCVVLGKEFPLGRDDAMARLARAGVETRPFFYPMHSLPMYHEPASAFPVAERLAARGINLPSSATLTEEEVAYVCRSLAELAA